MTVGAECMAHLWDNVALATLCYALAGECMGIDWPGAEWITPGMSRNRNGNGGA